MGRPEQNRLFNESADGDVRQLRTYRKFAFFAIYVVTAGPGAFFPQFPAVANYY